jgi:hypothetical protein
MMQNYKPSFPITLYICFCEWPAFKRSSQKEKGKQYCSHSYDQYNRTQGVIVGAPYPNTIDLIIRILSLLLRTPDSLACTPGRKVM